MRDTIYRESAIDAANRADYRGLTVEDVKKVTDEVVKEIKKLPSAQPEPCLNLIVSEIEETIRETRENGKHHDINVRTNGAMICFGLQLALEIIEEKRNERYD